MRLLYHLKMTMKMMKMMLVSDEHSVEVCLLHQVRLWKVSSPRVVMVAVVEVV